MFFFVMFLSKASNQTLSCGRVDSHCSPTSPSEGHGVAQRYQDSLHISTRCSLSNHSTFLCAKRSKSMHVTSITMATFFGHFHVFIPSLSFEDFEIHDPEARCRELHLLWPESQFWHRVLLSKKRSKHFKFDIR